MQIDVAVDTQESISCSGILLIRNLGPGVLYVAREQEDATLAAGFKIDVNESYEFPRPLNEMDGDNTVWLHADTDACDVRWMES